MARATQADLDLLSEAWRTLWETFVIGYTMFERPRANAPFTSDAWHKVFLGSDSASTDRDAIGRNTQFELFLAAELILGGADVRPGEPDLRMYYHGEYVGIAVKRVRSTNPRTLRSAFRDAVHQIEGSTGTGFIAANLDSWIAQLRTDSDVEELGASFHSLVREAHERAHQLSEKPALLGAMLEGTAFRWDTSGAIPRVEFHSVSQIRCYTPTDRDVERVNEFFGPLQARKQTSIRGMMTLVARPAV